MWTITIGATAGVSSSLQQAVVAVLDAATEYWGRYIDFGGATLEIELSFENFGDDTLAEGGTDFFALTSGPNTGLLQAAPIIELTTGTDMNGAVPDIFISVDATRLMNDLFYFGGGSGPGARFDLFTVLVHELAHGLGFISFSNGVGPAQAVFDTFLSGSVGFIEFFGPVLDAEGFGPIAFDDTSHYRLGELLSAFISPGEQHGISRYDTLILKQVGLPLLEPTSGDDTLYGHGTPQSARGNPRYADDVDLLAGNDLYYALNGDDTVRGGAGDDTIHGDEGYDALFGDAGNDTIFGGADADMIDGGLGSDALHGGDGNDTLLSGGGGGDALFGDDGDDILRFGVDGAFDASSTGGTADGGDGNDMIFVGAALSLVDGGAGGDTITLTNAGSGAYISLRDGTLLHHGVTISIQSIENVVGTDRGDDIRGDDFDNEIAPGDGNDVVFGYGGNDRIIAGSSATDVDTFHGGDGDDLLVTNALSTAYGGAGNDTLAGQGTYFGDDGDDDITGGVNIIRGGNGNDILRGLNAYGDAGDDLLIARTAGLFNGAVLDGGAGDDELTGNRFGDTLIGGAGADRLDGDDDIDTADFSSASRAVGVDFALGVGTLGDARGDTYVNVENIVGSQFADFLTGDVADNEILGGVGDDFIRGREGNDRLFGGAGVDTVLGGSGDDFLNGGAGGDMLDGQGGSDWASYAGASGRVALELYLGAGRVGDAAGDQYTSIENVIGGDGGDYIVGSAGGNWLMGGAGWDNLIGAGGDDILTGGRGRDILNGGAGRDAADYSDAETGVTVLLYTGEGQRGDALGDTFFSIQDVFGSNLNDFIAGDAQANLIRGGLGDDIIYGGNGWDNLQGGEGDDILRGGIGSDILRGGSGLDLADYTASAQGLTVNLTTGVGGGEASGDIFDSIEGIIGSRFDDHLTGSDQVFEGRLEGGRGDDTIVSTGVRDTIVFRSGDGDDFISGFVIDRYDAVIRAPRGDRLELSLGADFDTFAEVIAVASDVDGDAVFDFGGGDRLVFEGVSTADFYEEMFFFPDAVGASSTTSVSMSAVLSAEPTEEAMTPVLYRTQYPLSHELGDTIGAVGSAFDDPLV